MRKLFLSYTSLLSQLSRNAVSAEDLVKGLFFFGCSREHVYNPGANGETDERTWDKGNYAKGYPQLLEAVQRAECEGRLEWRRAPDGSERSPWDALNELLQRNGLKQVSGDPFNWEATYPAIADAIGRDSAAPVRVVY
jgi:hypothetical protein